MSSSSLVTVALGRTNKKVNFTPELQHLSRLERRSVGLSDVYSVAFTVLLVLSYCPRSWRPTYGDILSPDWTTVATFFVRGDLTSSLCTEAKPRKKCPVLFVKVREMAGGQEEVVEGSNIGSLWPLL